MHSTFSLHRSPTFRFLFRRSSSISSSPIIKVFSSEEDQNVKLSFKYSNSTNFNLRASKAESVQNLLSRIKVMAAFQHKKEEIRQSIYNPSSNPKVKLTNKKIDVCLIQNNAPLDENLLNEDAWTQASTLQIGDTFYEIKYNMPSVTNLSIPDFIVSGCPIRPHYILECACLNDTTFCWYRSITKEIATVLINEGKSNEVLIEDEQYWLKVAEGFVYLVSLDDIGRHLKVVCTPGQNGKLGCKYSVQSSAVVEAAPKTFPFEERQMHTKSFCDDSSVRCVSYNVLANMYVERKKFPYTSSKARDHYYRKQILIRELIGYNSDIICLQEVQDRMYEFDLVPVLNQLGYIGFYNRKGGRRFEGLATFFHSSKFRIIKEYGVLLNQIIKKQDIYFDLLTKVARNYEDMSKLLLQHTVLQVSLLQNIYIPELQILVANTHLYSNKDKPEVRLIQAAVCTHYIEHVIKKENLESVPMLFCGDFNSLPNSETVDFMLSGNYECCPSWHKDSDASADKILRHNLLLDSACGTPDYTNYTEEFQGCLDYIFYSKNLLSVKEVVPMPRLEDVVANVALPSELFPSDHIALVCTLQWNKS